MAFAPEFRSELRDSLLSQAGPLIAGVSSAPQALRAVELGENFQLWFLPQEAITSSRGPLSSVAVPLKKWHSQIFSNGEPAFFVWGHETGNAQQAYEIDEIFESPLAGSVGNAIRWIDDNIDDSFEARILSVPSYLLTSFWLVGPASDFVVVIQRPEKIDIPLRMAIASDEFLGILRSTPSVEGILTP